MVTMASETYASAACKLAQRGPEVSASEAKQFLEAWPLSEAFGELAKEDLDVTQARDICSGLAIALGTGAGVDLRDQWLPYALRGMGSETHCLRDLAQQQLRRVVTASQSGYPPEFRAQVAAQVLALLTREARDYSAPSGIAAEHLLCEPDVLAYVCSNPALRRELARIAGPPNLAEARLRAATIALHAVRFNPDLADELLPLVARLLRIAKVDVLATMGALECIYSVVRGEAYDGGHGVVASRERKALGPAVTALILDALLDPLMALIQSDEPSLRNSALVLLCKLVAVVAEDSTRKFDWKKEQVLSTITSLLNSDDPKAAVAAIKALNSHSKAGAIWVIYYDGLLQRLVSLALSSEARSGTQRAAAREALAAVLAHRPEGVEDKVKIALEKEASPGWPSSLTSEQGPGEERLAAQHLLRALLGTSWGTAGVCRDDEALRRILAQQDGPLVALSSAVASGGNTLYGPVTAEEREAIVQAQTRVNRAASESKAAQPQVATMEL